jgi:hypothetical protein
MVSECYGSMSSPPRICQGEIWLEDRKLELDMERVEYELDGMKAGGTSAEMRGAVKALRASSNFHNEIETLTYPISVDKICSVRRSASRRGRWCPPYICTETWQRE